MGNRHPVQAASVRTSKDGPPDFPRKNNLDWLRLIFALQVVLEHMEAHMGLRVPWFVAIFPGVPAFFFVSGFLIYSSYRNSPGKQYAENRFLRLFPALVFVTLGSCLVTLVAHGWRSLFQHPMTYAIWAVAQLTLGQAYILRYSAISELVS